LPSSTLWPSDFWIFETKSQWAPPVTPHHFAYK
jgi:hypothetical protein